MSDFGYRIAKLSCVPLRAKPSDTAEQVSQILAGEIVIVLSECEGNWFEVTCLYDGYKGFADPRHFSIITDLNSSERKVVNTPLSKWIDPQTKRSITLPAGAILYSKFEGEYLGDKLIWGDVENPFGASPYSIHEAALQFLGAPYQWGGKTVLGIDCSGLSQIAARLVGVRLLRDASEQAEQGESVEWGNRCVNDLAFFKNSEGKITHVGILISRDKIIHASGEVRIDRLIEVGIIHSESEKKTHQMSHLRRLPKQED